MANLYSQMDPFLNEGNVPTQGQGQGVLSRDNYAAMIAQKSKNANEQDDISDNEEKQNDDNRNRQVASAKSGTMDLNSSDDIQKRLLNFDEPLDEAGMRYFMNADADQKEGYLMGRQLNTLDEYGVGISKLEGQIDDIESSEQPVNYSAMMMLTDQWTGSNFSKLYKAPRTPEEKKDLVMQLRKSVNNQKLGLANTRTGMLKALMSKQVAQEKALAAKSKNKNKPIKQWEWDAARYGQRALAANDIMNNLDFDKINKLGLVEKTGAAKLGSQLGVYDRDPEVEKYEQAAEAFINAVLRDESGAAISFSEMTATHMQYIDLPNQTPEAREQKRAARERLIEAQKNKSGEAWKSFIAEKGLTKKRAKKKFKLPKNKRFKKINGGTSDDDFLNGIMSTSPKEQQ